MRWRFTLVLSLVIAAMVVVACGDDEGSSTGSSDSGDSGDPITIGFAMGFSGFANAFDGPVFNGAQIAIDDYNADGGVNGQQFEIVKSDTKSDLARVPQAALDVIEQGADIVVTTCDYDYGGPAAREANKQGILAIGCAGSPLFGKQGIGELTFNSLATTPTEAGALATYASDQGWSNGYLLADTTIAYSKDGCNYIQEALEHEGIGIAGTDTFQNDDASISAQVSRMADSDADFVVLCSYLPGVTSAVRQIRAGGIDLPILGQAGVDGRSISAGVPKLNDLYYVAIGSIYGEDQDERLTELGQKYEELTGKLDAQDYAPILGYAEIQTIAKGLEATGGSTDGQELADAIQQFNEEDLLSGPITYSEECHTPIDFPWNIFAVQDGKVELAESRVKPNFVPDAPC